MDKHESPFHLPNSPGLLAKRRNDEPVGCVDVRTWRWKIIDSMRSFLPFVRDIPSKFLIYLGGAILLLLFSIFIVVFILGYYSSLKTTFLSPSDQLTNENYCQSIATTNTGTFLATKSGYWQNSPNFEYYNASYIASIAALSIAESEYVNLMSLIFDYLQLVGSRSVQLNLALNLVYWMTVNFYVPYEKSQRFYLTGDPKVVFNRQYQGGFIGSRVGTCNASSLTTFDQNTGQFSLSFNYQEFQSNSICSGIVSPSILGYRNGINSNTFSVHFDIRTLITAVSVNLNILFLVDLVEIPESQANVTSKTTSDVFKVAKYYYQKFPGMPPVTCISNSTAISGADGFSQCVVTVGDVIGIPVYHHAGANFTSPVPCNCNQSMELDLDNPFALCNLFSFISGFLFWPSENTDFAIAIAEKFGYDYLALNDASFNASFINSYWGQTSPMVKSLSSNESLTEAFSFCEVLGENCTLVAFSSFDGDYSTNWAISEYYYQVPRGACRDTFTTSHSDWQRLIDTPFAPLTEGYQKCRDSPTVVLLNQAGIAMGNVNLLAPLVAIFSITVFFVFRYFFFSSQQRNQQQQSTCQCLSWTTACFCCSKKAKQEFESSTGGDTGAEKALQPISYCRAELSRANEVLAYALLLARDKQLQSLNGMKIEADQVEAGSILSSKAQSLIYQLVQELESLPLDDHNVNISNNNSANKVVSVDNPMVDTVESDSDN